ncbi:DUF5995 family protein [Rhodococcus marinonascens]|uniref:DUF5995 family protein n=1 Tax=Rhodococcus marinonascens TaxID=38311 RepID=UPI000A873EFD|nr:DUF5995 family protein [Rhodococcus marinonascens]
MKFARVPARFLLATFVAAVSTAVASPPLAPAEASNAIATACGTPLTAADIGRIVALSDISTLPAAASLDRLEEEVARHEAITAILVRHRDRRGLFSLGLDAVERTAVMPMQRDPAAFVNRDWGHAVSSDLLRRYLVNLHAEFTGAPVEPHWAQYFTMSKQCEARPAEVAMMGYNAHLTVDLAYAVATAATTRADVPDYYRIVDSIALQADTIVEGTRDVYGADLGPLWRFYLLGEGLDRLSSEDVSSEFLLRAADGGYNTLTLAHGFALKDPRTAATAETTIGMLHQANNKAIGVLSDLGGL